MDMSIEAIKERHGRRLDSEQCEGNRLAKQPVSGGGCEFDEYYVCSKHQDPEETAADLTAALARIDADAKVIAELRADLYAAGLREKAHADFAAELRAVVGPKMPCGCWAVEMREHPDFTGLRCLSEDHSDWTAETPEYLAWQDSRSDSVLSATLRRYADMIEVPHTCKPPLGNPTREEAMAECAVLRADLTKAQGRCARLADSLDELRAVVGPKLTCCDEWAIRHSDTTSDEEAGRILRWCPRRGYWLEAEPEFLAWIKSRGTA